MDRVECVVVGAGPAGSACAIGLARKGVETVLVDRGRYAGEKNVASFVLFANVLETIIPNYREEAPLERIGSDTGFICLLDKQVRVSSICSPPARDPGVGLKRFSRAETRCVH